LSHDDDDDDVDDDDDDDEEEEDEVLYRKSRCLIVYITFQFTTVNQDTKQMSERGRNARKTDGFYRILQRIICSWSYVIKGQQ
jgi:hypothetical protein